MANNKNYYSGSSEETTAKAGSQLTFNLIGAQPTSVEYIVEKKIAEKILKDIASEALNDGDPSNNIVSAKFVLLNSNDFSYDERTKKSSSKPRVSAQVIIPARNSNIVSSEGNDFIRPEDTVHYSDKFKQFVNAYCNEDNKNVYLTKPKREGGISYRAIIIDIPKFFGRIFDYNGYAYREANGKGTQVEYVDLQTDCIFEYTGNHKISDIVAFRIKKSFQNTSADKNIVFDVFDTRKKKNWDDDNNRDNGRRDDFDRKDFRREYRK